MCRARQSIAATPDRTCTRKSLSRHAAQPQSRLRTDREQERRQKAEDARRETERLLRNQQAELEAKKADMARRDLERDAARSAAAAEATLQNQAAKAKVPAQFPHSSQVATQGPVGVWECGQPCQPCQCQVHVVCNEFNLHICQAIPQGPSSLYLRGVSSALECSLCLNHLCTLSLCA